MKLTAKVVPLVVLATFAVLAIESYVATQAQRPIFDANIARDLALSLASTALVVVIGLRAVARPLAALLDKVRRAEAGDLSRPIDVRSRDELGELSIAVNSLCADLAELQQRLRAESDARTLAVEQLRHHDRLRSIGRLASGVAHELGTPLSVTGGRASMIASGRLSPEEIVESATIIRSQTDRMTEIVQHVLGFARSRPQLLANVDVRKVVRDAIALVEPSAREHGTIVREHRGDAAIMVRIDPVQIGQVITNMIVNAVQASDADETVDVGVESTTATAHPTGPGVRLVRLFVRDRGTGIAHEDLKRVFDPFFTTKEAGHGTGLGLSIAYGIVREHGGWIEVESEPGRGSCFTTFLPQAAST